MTEIKVKKQYDLEDRTFNYAKRVRDFVRKLPRTMLILQDGPQLIRSSGSVGANYIEANESLSKKDFIMRIKICRKEAKESRYWIRLIDPGLTNDMDKERLLLMEEAGELMRIFGAILQKSK